MTRRELLLAAVLVEGGLGVIAYLLGWLLDVPFWRPLALTWADAGLGLAASLPMLAAFFVCLRWPWGPWRHMEPLAREVMQPIFRDSRIVDLALICVLAGIGEEWLFRGFLQSYLTQFLGPAWALLLASLLFGLFHPFSIFYVVFATLFGLGLGGLMLARDDNLLAPAVAHAVYDFVALVCIVRRPPGGTVLSGSSN